MDSCQGVHFDTGELGLMENFQWIGVAFGWWPAITLFSGKSVVGSCFPFLFLSLVLCTWLWGATWLMIFSHVLGGFRGARVERLGRLQLNVPFGVYGVKEIEDFEKWGEFSFELNRGLIMYLYNHTVSIQCQEFCAWKLFLEKIYRSKGKFIFLHVFIWPKELYQ